MTRRLGALLRAAAAAAALIALVAGLPLLLAITIGSPLAAVPDLLAGDVSDTVVINLLATIAYLAWAQFAIAVAGEVVAAIRRAPAPRLPGIFSGQQHLAHTLVTAALLAAPTVSVATVPPPLTSQAALVTSTSTYPAERVHAAGHDAPTITLAAANPDPRSTGRPAAAPAARASAAHEAREVLIDADGPGTFWDLAETHLGDGQRWPDLWALNQGRRQADGEVMNEPGLLRPGWTVLLPDDAVHKPTSNTGSVRGDSRPSATVEPGDTLSGIAAEHDVEDWKQLWDVNRGRLQRDGERLDDPDQIEPGWVIDLPPSAQEQEPAESSAGPGLSATPPSEAGAASKNGDGVGRAEDVVPVVPTSSTRAMPRHRAVNTASQAPTVSPNVRDTTFQSDEDDEQGDGADSGADSGAATLVGAGFGGGLLTGLTLAALTHRRRRQFRYRRPGRAIAATPPDLLAVERVVRATGSAGILDVTWLDQATRSLAHHMARDTDGRLPDVVAVRMTHDVLELVLARSKDVHPPAPWVTGHDGRRWSVRRGDDLGYDARQREFGLAPYPALVSVGYTAEGEQWRLDLEHVGLCQLSGDPGRCTNFLRFVAAELAHNVWSEELDVDLVGIGEELIGLNPDRLHHVEDPNAAAEVYLARRAAVRAVLEQSGTDVLTGRLRNADAADMLMPRVLLVGATDAGAGASFDGRSRTGHRHAGGVPWAFSRLNDRTLDFDSRAATAAVVVVDDGVPGVDEGSSGASPRAAGWELHVDSSGRLRIPALELELIAQQAPQGEAVALARLLASAAGTADRAIPPSRGDQPWDIHADAAGALLPQLTVSRASLPSEQLGPASMPGLHLAARRLQPPADEGRSAGELAGSSVLPQPAGVYVRDAATTAEDVTALGPAVPDEVRRQVEDADPTLDEDLADWHDPACPLPRLTLLGPIDVRAHGPLPEVRPRRAWNAEVVAYLACHPRGVTAEQLGTDLWPGDPDIAGKSKLRQAIHITRKWLGHNPRTGRDHLPAATPSPAGPALYRVESILVDAELFRRLRLRGVARGDDGVSDLHAALDLVSGAPFDQRRAGGYSWLAEKPLDHEYTAMIVDVAHLVATRHLAAGELDLARSAAQTALNAGSSDDIALLDLVAVCDAEGNRAEADRLVKRILANHDAEVEEDLPPRTAEILHRRRWVGQAS